MAKVLITGINGFTGQYMAKEMLQAGYEVTGISNFDSDASDDVKIYRADLNFQSQLVDVISNVKPDYIVHLAAIAFVAHGDVDAIYKTNLMGTRNLLESIVISGIEPKSILIASSANVYGNSSLEVIDESVTAAPANDYAVSKLAMEYMAKLWFDKLPIVITRPFNYIGVSQTINFLVPKIVDHFKRKAEQIELGNLNVIRDFSDVRFVVNSYRKLLESGVSGETFNLCSGVGHSLTDIVNSVAELAGYKPELVVNPAFVRANEVHRLIGSRKKLEAIIDISDDYKLMDTLAWMYRA